jgi:hypothetical protein
LSASRGALLAKSPQPIRPSGKSASENPKFLLRDSPVRGINASALQNCLEQMQHTIHDKSLDAKKARILINALMDCARAGVRSSFSIKEMICGVSLYLECGKFTRENWRLWHRLSDAAKLIRDSGDKDWKRHCTFEHARPINVMYRMMLDERATLTLERAAIIIGEYPPVLITVEEEMRMAKLGFMHDGVPEKRYAHIPISGFSLRSDVAAARKIDPRKNRSKPRTAQLPAHEGPRRVENECDGNAGEKTEDAVAEGG